MCHAASVSALCPYNVMGAVCIKFDGFDDELTANASDETLCDSVIIESVASEKEVAGTR